MNEAEIRIAQKILPRDWTSLREVVLKVIDFFEGPRGPGLAMVNRYLHAGLLELARVDPNGTMTEFSRMDCKHRTIHAPLLNPAEGVRVEPSEAGHYLARLAESTSPATLVAVSPQELLHQLPSARSSDGDRPVNARSPDDDRPVASTAAKGKRQRKKEAQENIAEAAKKIWPDDGTVPSDFGPADLMHAVETLYKDEAAAKGPKEKPRDCPSWSSFKRFLEAQRMTSGGFRHDEEFFRHDDC